MVALVRGNSTDMNQFVNSIKKQLKRQIVSAVNQFKKPKASQLQGVKTSGHCMMVTQAMEGDGRPRITVSRVITGALSHQHRYISDNVDHIKPGCEVIFILLLELL